jgi:hypothetical protein
MPAKLSAGWRPKDHKGMTRKTQQAEYGRLIEACRQLWNEFDPIGVFEDGDGPRDEYDAYLPQTVKLALSGADVFKFAAYLRTVVYVNMGMLGFPERKIDEFAARLRERLCG